MRLTKVIPALLKSLVYGRENNSVWSDNLILDTIQCEVSDRWTVCVSGLNHSFVSIDNTVTPTQYYCVLQPNQSYPYNIVSALHEVAHTKYIDKGNGGGYATRLLDLGFDLSALQQLPSCYSSYPTSIKRLLDTIYHEEKLCWKWALQRARDYGITVDLATRKQIHASLATYNPKDAGPSIVKTATDYWLSEQKMATNS